MVSASGPSSLDNRSASCALVEVPPLIVVVPGVGNILPLGSSITTTPGGVVLPSTVAEESSTMLCSTVLDIAALIQQQGSPGRAQLRSHPSIMSC